MAEQTQRDDPSKDIRAIKGAIVRHWGVALVLISLSVFAMALLTALMTPLYLARSSVLIENRSPAVVQGASGASPIAVASREATEAQRVLAKTRPVIARAMQLTSPTRDDGTQRVVSFARGRAEATIESQLLVLSVFNEDPQDAADAANAWTTAFVEEMIKQEQSTTAYMRDFLSQLIPALRETWMAKQKALRDYETETKFDPRELDKNPANVHYAQYAQQVTEAQARILLLQSEMKMWEAAQGDTQALMPTPRARADTVVSEYARRILDQKLQIHAIEQAYAPGSPVILKAREAMKELEDLARTPLQAAYEALKTDTKIANDQLKELTRLLEGTQKEYEDLKSKASRHEILAFEADLARKQYEALAERQQTAELEGSVDICYAKPWEQAEKPRYPAWPSWPKNLLIGLLIGMGLAAVMVYLLEILDDTVHSVAQLQEHLGLGVLGTVPLLDKRLARNAYKLALEHPSAPAVESLRDLRTSLTLAYCGEEHKATGLGTVILVTSPGVGDGKSFAAMNLSALYASLDKRVLLIDADLFRHTSSSMHGEDQGKDLAEVLSGPQRLQDLVRTTSLPRLSLLPFNRRIPNPPAVIESPNFAALIDQARNSYDIVIIDSPPVLVISAASLLAEKCDVTLVVVRARVTRLGHVQRTAEALQRAKAKATAYLINALGVSDAAASGYGYGYGSGYHYGYYRHSRTKKDEAEQVT